MLFAQTPHERARRRRIFGLALALVLTLAAFGLTRAPMEHETVLAMLSLLAALQMGVHLVFFLDVGRTGASPFVNLAVGFSLLLILIMVGGTFWVISDLHVRMMV